MFTMKKIPITVRVRAKRPQGKIVMKKKSMKKVKEKAARSLLVLMMTPTTKGNMKVIEAKTAKVPAVGSTTTTITLSPFLKGTMNDSPMFQVLFPICILPLIDSIYTDGATK